MPVGEEQTQKAVSRFLFALFLTACAPSVPERPRAPAGDPRVVSIRADFAKLRRYQTCEEPHPAESVCGLLADFYWDEQQVLRYIESSCPGSQVGVVCWAQFRLRWYTELFKRYARANLRANPDVACGPGACPSPWREELQMLGDHNADVERDEAVALLEVANEERQRRAEREEAEREKGRKRALILQALGAAAGAYSSSLSQQRRSNEPGLAQSRCSSDFGCAVGFVCAKDSGAITGVCARAVNQYGVPEIHMPDPASVGPGTGNCQFDGNCPVGFRCVKSSGGLYGNCMK